jgi:hypothetical protein
LFTNKHVVIALIVAPILSVLAWFAVSSWVGEKPRAAEAGNSYPLVAQSNCRWPSGQCDMENQDFSLSISIDSNRRLVLVSRHALDGVMLALGDASVTSQPRAMTSMDAVGLHWELPLESELSIDDRIQLVARAGGRQFFGDAATVFATEDTRPAPVPNR